MGDHTRRLPGRPGKVIRVEWTSRTVSPACGRWDFDNARIAMTTSRKIPQASNSHDNLIRHRSPERVSKSEKKRARESQSHGYSRAVELRSRPVGKWGDRRDYPASGGLCELGFALTRALSRGQSNCVLVPSGSGVTDGTRTRNNQNHNLGLYH